MAGTYSLSAIAAALVLSGCTTIPDLELDPIDVRKIVDNLNCELKAATLEQNDLFKGWQAAAVLTLKVFQKGSVDGSGSFVIPVTPGFLTVSFGAGKSAEASREETIEYGPRLAAIQKLPCKGWPDDTGRLLAGEVGMSAWLKRFAETGINSNATATTFTALFVIKKTGSVNPAFSMIPVGKSVFGGGIKLAANQSATHKLYMALTPPSKPKKKADPIEVIVVDYRRKPKVRIKRVRPRPPARRKSVRPPTFSPYTRDNKDARDAIQRQREDTR